MKSISKLIIDIGPLAVFFVFYTKNGLQGSILPFMIATVIAVIFSYILEKKIPIMPTVGATIVLLFGGLTFYFDNETGSRFIHLLSFNINFYITLSRRKPFEPNQTKGN